MWNQNVGLRSGQLAPLSCGSLVWLFSQPGWHRACWLLWQRYGTLDLRLLDMRMQQLPLGSDIWLLGVIGFGLLAGIIPLHGWVPQAHANASAPAAALFSTVVMKIGLLGILTLIYIKFKLMRVSKFVLWGMHTW